MMSFFIKQWIEIKDRCLERKKQVKKNAHRKAITKQRRFEKSLANNPYLQSRALWNDMYGSIQTKLENSYRVIFILSLVILSAIIGLVVIAGETKIKPMPFIVHGNEVLTVANANTAEFQSLKPTLAAYFIKKFIRNARTVSADGQVNANNKIAALSFVTGEATQVLKEFYEGNNPNTIAQQQVKNIIITSVLKKSANTMDVRWHEDSRNVHSGERLQSQDYIAQLNYHYQTPSQNEIILRHNPLGLAITHLAWSIDQQ